MFTATLNRNFRTDIGSEDMVLLTNIQKDDEEFRDHAWVELRFVHKHVPKNNRYKATITFDAIPRSYTNRMGTSKKLTAISNVKKVAYNG